MKCPYCKQLMNYSETSYINSMVERRAYDCMKCFRNFERIILKNQIGLIRDDTLCELDTNGNHIRLWE